MHAYRTHTCGQLRGSDVGNGGGCVAEDAPSHDLPASLSLTLPPLATLILRAEE